MPVQPVFGTVICTVTPDDCLISLKYFSFSSQYSPELFNIKNEKYNLCYYIMKSYMIMIFIIEMSSYIYHLEL